MAAATLKEMLKRSPVLAQVAWLTGQSSSTLLALIDAAPSTEPLTIVVAAQQSPPGLVGHLTLHQLTITATLDGALTPIIELSALGALGTEPPPAEPRPFAVGWVETHPDLLTLRWQATPHSQPLALLHAGDAAQGEAVAQLMAPTNSLPAVPGFTALDHQSLTVEALMWEVAEGQLAFSATYLRLPDWAISADLTVSAPCLSVHRTWAPDARFEPILTITGAVVLHQRTRVVLSLMLPQIAFEGTLAPEQGPISMDQLFTDLGADFDIWPTDLFVSRLALRYTPTLDPTTDFAFAFAGDWPLMPGIWLECVGADLALGPQTGLDLALFASLRLFPESPNEVVIELLAEYQQAAGARQLCFMGATAAGQHIRLGALVDELLAESGLDLQLPDPLHTLVVSDLDVELTISQQPGGEAGATHTERWLALRVTLGSSAGPWEIIPGLLSLEPATIGVQLGEGVVAVTISETVAVLGVSWLVDLQLPSLRGSLTMVGEGYHIQELLAHFHLPVEGLERATLAAATMSFDGVARTTMLHLELADPWDQGGFHIRDVAFELTYQGGQGGGLTARFTAACEIQRASDPANPLQLQLAASHPGPGLGWQLAGRGGVDPAHGLTLQEVAAHFGVSLTELAGLGELAAIALYSLALTYDTHTGQFALECAARLGSDATLALSLQRLRQPDGSRVTRFGGQLLVHGLEWDLLFNHDGHGDALVGVFHNPGGGVITVGNLLAALSDDQETAEALSALNFKLKNAMIAYERGSITRSPQPGREPVQRGEAKVLLALDMDAGLDLSGLGRLPLVGQAFHGSETLAVQFSPIIATRPFSADEVAAITALLPPGAGRLPEGEIVKGFHLHAIVQLGDQRQPLRLDGPAETVRASPESGLVATEHPPLAVPPSPPPGITWLPLQKTLARILTLRRVGLGFQSPTLTILLDGGISVGGLTLDLMGLGASYDFKSRALAFALTGVGLSLDRDPLRISAAFLNLDGDFMGTAQLVTPRFGLTALGGFTMKLGSPALFLYGLLDEPLGGPAFFFVEGLAAGFGFNRRLTLPDVSEVNSFPFVADAVGAAQGLQPPGLDALASAPADGVGAQLTRLGRFVSPALGEHFLAVGIKFNSLRLLDAFALLVLRLNTNSTAFLIDMVGVATLKVPSESPEVLAFIQLNIRASIDPQAGVILMQMQLTPQSWLISPECHLQGGVAVGLWLRGEQAGDFVYCVGGYHPHFKRPAHYPQVPRLGFSWQLSDTMSLKGDLYYALTPVAAMAGGHLAANWHSGDLKAWFNLGIDLLIQWKPFHYEASAFIEIGASYDSPFGTISGSLGADVTLWGPDFSGRAHFHFGPFGFSVEFGSAGQRAPDPIDWTEFKRSFLPVDPAKLLSLTVTSGLLRTIEVNAGPRQGTWWLINPKTFSLDASTLLPVTRYVVAPDEPELSADQRPHLPEALTVLGLAPMNRRRADFPESTLTVTITRDGHPIAAAFSFTTQPKQFPAALWGEGFQSADSDRLVTGAGGLLITPHAAVAPGATSPIARDHLNYDDYTLFATRTPETGRLQSLVGPRDAAQQRRDRTALQAALQAPEVVAARRAALEALGIDAARAIQLRPTIADDFVVAPRLALTP